MEAGPNPCHEKSWLHAISSPPRHALAVHGSERSEFELPWGKGVVIFALKFEKSFDAFLTLEKKSAPLFASPIARVRWCACPCPPHPVHSPTQYTLPPEDGWPAAPPRLHMGVLGSARPTTLLPPRPSPVVAGHPHTRTHAHSDTAPSGQAHTHHTLVESHRGATPAQPAYCST